MKLLYVLLGSICVGLAVHVVHAQVVISEVLWVGSEVSSADEWLELQVHPSFTGSFVTISNWQLLVRGSNGEPKVIHTFATGSIVPAVKPMLIANFSAANSHLLAEPEVVTTSVSLLNNGLQIWLRNAAGELIDEVDDGIGAPFAGGKLGDPPTYISMQRVNLAASGTLSSNWRNSTTILGVRSGSLVVGTPGFIAPVLDLSSSSTGLVTSSSSSVSSVTSSSSGSILSSSSSSSSNSSTTGAQIITPQWHLPWEYTQLFISEVLPNPVGTDTTEYIDLVYTGTGTLQLAGVTLADASGKSFVIGSGALTTSGAVRAFFRPDTGIDLNNTTDTITLGYSGTVLQVLTYAAAPEGIAWQQNASGTVVPNCYPQPHTLAPSGAFMPYIDVQSTNAVATASGVLTQTGSVQINLQLSTQTGTLALATCNVLATDGWQSTSCNPPSHTFTQFGTGSITAIATNYCGTTVQQTLQYNVLQSTNSTTSTAQKKSVTAKDSAACMPSIVSGIWLSELLVNPTESEAENEWIELHNPNPFAADLCGWQLDDIADGGSKPFALDDIQIPANGYTVLMRPQTGIALNNSHESVRLLAPVGLMQDSPVTLVHEVQYEASYEQMTYARRNDGVWLWTPYNTPYAANQFKTALRRYPVHKLIVQAALPNPTGTDSPATEWVEVSNNSSEPFALSGWQLATKPGGKLYTFTEGTLQPYEVLRITGIASGLGLSNTLDQIRLLDPDGYVTSVVAWRNAKENFIYRAPAPPSEPVQVQIMAIEDANTLQVRFTNPDELRLLPPSVKRAWLAAVQSDGAAASLQIGLRGILAPATKSANATLVAAGTQAAEVVQTALAGATITLRFDSDIWATYNRAEAYVYTNEQLLQAQLLQQGMAIAYSRTTYTAKDLFMAYQVEAQSAVLGVWNTPLVRLDLQAELDQAELDQQALQAGIQVHISQPSGLVASGTVVTLSPSIPADIFVSVNSGAFVPSSGTYTLTGSVQLAAYASRMVQSGASIVPITSKWVRAEYTVLQAAYPLQVYITEVFPAPRTGQNEWVELYNASATPADLSGWLLDDAQGAGSRPWRIPVGTMLAPHEARTFSNTQTKLALNNGGDEVWLIAPNGETMAGVQYTSLKKEQSVVFATPKFLPDGTYYKAPSGCVSDVPSPNMLADCIVLPAKHTLPDTDQDLVPDVYEQLLYHTNANMADTDADGWSDGFELASNLDPLVTNSGSRLERLLYKKFIQKNTSVKFMELKTKPSRLSGKASGIRSVQVTVKKLEDPQVAAYMQTIAVQSGSWRTDLPFMASGAYLAQVQFTDLAGKDSVINTQFVVTGKRAVNRTKNVFNTVPNWAQFKKQYWAANIAEATADQALLQLFASPKVTTNNSWLVWALLLAFGGACIVGGLGVWFFKRHDSSGGLPPNPH